MDQVKALQNEFRTLVADFFARQTNEPFAAAMKSGNDLSGSDEGRIALTELLDDPDPFVRAHAAGYVIEFDEAPARKVLEALIDSDSPAQVQAEMILTSFDEPFDEADFDVANPS